MAAGDGSVLIGVDSNMNYITEMMTSFQFISRWHGFVFVINFQENEKLHNFSKNGGGMFLRNVGILVPNCTA
jgi:hypothetical protein